VQRTPTPSWIQRLIRQKACESPIALLLRNHRPSMCSMIRICDTALSHAIRPFPGRRRKKALLKSDNCLSFQSRAIKLSMYQRWDIRAITRTHLSFRALLPVGPAKGLTRLNGYISAVIPADPWLIGAMASPVTITRRPCLLQYRRRKSWQHRTGCWDCLCQYRSFYNLYSHAFPSGEPRAVGGLLKVNIIHV